MSAHSRCFLTSVGLRQTRSDSASIRRLSVYPGSPALPAMLARVMPYEAASVRLMLRPADLVGTTDWVGQPDAALLGYRVGAIAAWLLPTKPALYLFIQTGN